MSNAKDILMIVHIMGNMDPSDNDRFTYLAKMLMERGHSVEIVTSDFMHSEKRYRNCDETRKKWDFSLSFLHEPEYQRNISIKRIFAHWKFGKNLKRYLKNRKKPDCIYLAFPPVNSSRVATRYAKRNNIKILVDVQDLWPEAFAIKFGNNPFTKLAFLPMMASENKVFREASVISSVSYSYTRRALSVNKGQKKGIVAYLGSDGLRVDSALKQRNLVKDDGLKHIVYLGNLGNNYDFVNVFKALEELKRRGHLDLCFDVLGDGDRKQELVELAGKHFPNTVFWGYMPYSKAIQKLSESYLALNPLVKDSSSSIVNKVGDYAAAGVPVVNSQNSEEYKQLIAKYRCGLNANSEDFLDIADKIEVFLHNPEMAKAYGLSNRELFDDMFDRRNSYLEIVEALVE